MAKKEDKLLFKNELMWDEEQKKKNKKPFYKNWKTYAISLGIIVIGTGTGLGIYYGVNAHSVATPTTITDQDIVTSINNTSYELTATAGDDATVVNNIVTVQFMQNNIRDEQIKKAFDSKLFSFDENKITIDGKPLVNSDLTEAKTITAEINYRYGSLTEQTTNLTIIVNDNESKDLRDVMNNFNFTDSRGIEGFLELNDQETMKIQILTYLQRPGNWDESDLTLSEETNHSVKLTAKPSSKNYHGSVVLSWKLKLFEVWGIDTDLEEADPSLVEKDNRAELKGYFYLNANNQIEYFDVYGFKMKGRNNIVTVYDWLHDFNFTNDNESKNLKFELSDTTDNIAGKFGTFDLTSKITLDIETNHDLYRNVRFFNPETKQIELLEYQTTFEIDSLGKLTKLN